MKRAGLFFCFYVLLAMPLAAPIAAQTVPDAITRPQRGEASRYPRDVVIGDLGQGAAPDAAYRLARNVLAAIQRDARESPLFAGFGPARLSELFSGVGAVAPEKYRIGGGRVMPDGSVSFLVRFIGRERGIAGELYLRPSAVAGEDGAPLPEPRGPWRFDDLLLDEAHDTQVRREIYPYDFTPYERFY